MEKKGRVELTDAVLENIVGGVRITSKTVTNKDTGEVYDLLVDPMVAFSYATKHGNESDTDIINGMLAKGYIS